MTTLALPNFGNRISPRLEYAESLQLITIERKKIIKRETIKLLVHNNLERLNIITRIKPDILICDGISELSKERLAENKIKVYPWIHGEINIVLQKFLAGELKQIIKHKTVN